MSGEPNAGKTPPPLWRRVRAWAIVCILYGFALALAATSFVVLRQAFIHGLDITDRLYRLIGAALLLAFPALITRQFIRTKRTTGRWPGTREQSRQRVTQCAMGSQHRITSQQRSLMLFGLHWANIATRDPQSPVSKRLFGALVLSVYAAALLATCAPSIILIGAGVATFAPLGWMMILFGLILLFIPAQFIVALVRRFRTHGDLRSSNDDLSGIAAARGVWFDQQRQQPLFTKLVSAALCVAVLTVLWLRVTVYHSRHPHESWMLPLFWTAFALYLISNQFRKPKSSIASNNTTSQEGI
jgi:hypothetical protein